MSVAVTKYLKTKWLMGKEGEEKKEEKEEKEDEESKNKKLLLTLHLPHKLYRCP